MSALVAAQQVQPPVSETAAIVSMIERVARDPSVSIERLEKLLEMREQIEMRNAGKAFGAAMVAAQGEMRAVAADSQNPQTRSKYASYHALDKALRPIYHAHGFAPSFNTAEGAPENCIRVVCSLMHADGHTQKYHIDMPADGKGARGNDVMTRTHATGSAVTYGRRYLLIMMFNIAIGDDDDGNAAGRTTTNGNGGKISDEQLQALITGCNEVGRTTDQLARTLKVQSIDNLPTSRFNEAMAVIDSVRPKK